MIDSEQKRLLMVERPQELAGLLREFGFIVDIENLLEDLAIVRWKDPLTTSRIERAAEVLAACVARENLPGTMRLMSNLIDTIRKGVEARKAEEDARLEAERKACSGESPPEAALEADVDPDDNPNKGYPFPGIHKP